jgi:RNA polymerase sigma factor (sigma-70 family)
MDGRAYVEAHMDEVIKMVGAVVMRRVMPLFRSLPPFVRNDPTITADDMIWASVGDLWERATYYRPEETALSTWVYTCVPRYCASRIFQRILREQRTPPGYRMYYLDKRVRVNGEEQDATLSDFIATEENIEGDYVNRERMERIMKALDDLDDVERDAIISNAVKGETLKDIGKRYGISGEAIRQRRDKGLRLVRKRMGLEERGIPV